VTLPEAYAAVSILPLHGKAVVLEEAMNIVSCIFEIYVREFDENDVNLGVTST
jgi:hypothetical protein